MDLSGFVALRVSQGTLGVLRVGLARGGRMRQRDEEDELYRPIVLVPPMQRMWGCYLHGCSSGFLEASFAQGPCLARLRGAAGSASRPNAQHVMVAMHADASEGHQGCRDSLMHRSNSWELAQMGMALDFVPAFVTQG